MDILSVLTLLTYILSNKMRVLEIDDFNVTKVNLKRNDRIKILAWKTTRNIESNTFDVNNNSLCLLFNCHSTDDKNDIIKTYMLNINTLEAPFYKPNVWNKNTYNSSWLNIGYDCKFISISIMNLNAPYGSYKIGIADSYEDVNGIIEVNQVIDKKFAMDSVFTKGENKTIGAHCPIDNKTNKEMETCLNWRRTDPIGLECRKILSKKDMVDSSVAFCGVNPNAEDCRCVNRALQDDYKVKKNFREENDYCWYTPCASGYYLKENLDQFVCNSKLCQVNFNIGEVGESVNLESMNVECFLDAKKNKEPAPSSSPPPSQHPSSPKNKSLNNPKGESLLGYFSLYKDYYFFFVGVFIILVLFIALIKN